MIAGESIQGHLTNRSNISNNGGGVSNSASPNKKPRVSDFTSAMSPKSANSLKS